VGKVIVAGSINMDVVATATRYPRLGETVPGQELHFFPGGKGANQAVAAAKLGAPTLLIGRTGSDAFGRDLRAFLAAQGLSLDHVGQSHGTTTGTAMIVVVDAENAIVGVRGANALLSPADVAPVAISAADVLVSQCEIDVDTIRAFFERGRAAMARTIFNAAPAVEFDRSLLTLIDVLILNESELAHYSGRTITPAAPVTAIVEAVRALKIGERQMACVTLGARGAIAVVGTDLVEIPGRYVEAIDTTGAGDCFVGAFAARLALGDAMNAALDYANTAASICVQRMGAGPSMPSKGEVDSILRQAPA
jgi:ribokinase